MNLQTTLNILRAADPCAIGWFKLLRSLPADFDHDAPVDFSHILNINGLDDALWALRFVLPEQEKQCEREARLFACDCAEGVLHISVDGVARRSENSSAMKEELAVTWDALSAVVGAEREAARGSAKAKQEAQFRVRFCTQEASK